MMGERREVKVRWKKEKVREKSSKIKAGMRLGRKKNTVIKFMR